MFLINVSLGSVNIDLLETLQILTGSHAVDDAHQYIVLEYRLPKALSAIVVGCGLSISGLLMQTLFRNPLAGPYVLGLSSGGSLGVAILIMGASFLGGSLAVLAQSKYVVILAASLGSFIVLLMVIATLWRVRNTMALLIIGLMVASFTSAIVSVLSYFTTAENLQEYVFWSMGSLGRLDWQDLGILSVLLLTGILICISLLKKLNAFLLGEDYAKSMGVNTKYTRFLMIAITGILAGSVTAFAGPIAFIGLTIPHLARQLFNTGNHFVLLPAILLIGSLVMLLCETLSQLPGSAYVLPLNAVTSFIGAPIVIWLILKKQNLIF
jgi:iron complex transport system permease protein